VITKEALRAEAATGASRFPLRLVDRVLEVVPGTTARGQKLVSSNEPYFLGHFPGAPVFPGVLLCEALAQLGAIALGEGDDVGLEAVHRARFRRPVLPGDVLDLAVEVVPASGWRVRGSITSGDAPIAEIEFGLGRVAGPFVHPTAVVARTAELADDVRIGPYATIGPHVRLGAGTWVGQHAMVSGHTTLGRRNAVFPFAAVGTPPQDLKYRDEPSRLEIGDDNIVREHASVHPGTAGGGMVTRIGDGCLLMVSAHVGHDTRLGNNIVVAAGAAIGGHVVVDDFAIIGGLVGIHQFARVGESALCAAGSMVSADVPPFCTVAGDRARLAGVNTIGMRRRGIAGEVIRGVKRAYRLLFHGTGGRDAALARTRQALGHVPEVVRILDFVAASTRGVCR
jgi:UDP-N-acetylglucosamine acyltransferase